jgi:hypothetical protein
VAMGGFRNGRLLDARRDGTRWVVRPSGAAMMDRDTVQSEENQSALRQRDAAWVRLNLLRETAQWQEAANWYRERAGSIYDELGQFCDDLSNAIGRLEKSIEGDR